MVLPLDSALRCRDGRCGTLLAADAEVCDECGSSDLGPANETPGVLVGLAGDRPVAFGLAGGRATIVGRRGADGARPDIDLSRIPGSDSVHRRHASLELQGGWWQVTHLGRNPLIIQRPGETLVLQPGTTEGLRPGDWIVFGRVQLRLVDASDLRVGELRG